MFTPYVPASKVSFEESDFALAELFSQLVDGRIYIRQETRLGSPGINLDAEYSLVTYEDFLSWAHEQPKSLVMSNQMGNASFTLSAYIRALNESQQPAGKAMLNFEGAPVCLDEARMAYEQKYLRLEKESPWDGYSALLIPDYATYALNNHIAEVNTFFSEEGFSGRLALEARPGSGFCSEGFADASKFEPSYVPGVFLMVDKTEVNFTKVNFEDKLELAFVEKFNLSVRNSGYLCFDAENIPFGSFDGTDITFVPSSTPKETAKFLMLLMEKGNTSYPGADLEELSWGFGDAFEKSERAVWASQKIKSAARTLAAL